MSTSHQKTLSQRPAFSGRLDSEKSSSTPRKVTITEVITIIIVFCGREK